MHNIKGARPTKEPYKVDNTVRNTPNNYITFHTATFSIQSFYRPHLTT